MVYHPPNGLNLKGVKVTLEMESVTGRVRYYPVGENAKHVLTLTGKKTLSELEVEALKALGCEIERIRPTKSNSD